MSLGEIAEHVLDLARAALPGAEIEVKVDRTEAALTRFANSFIHQNVADDTTSVWLRAHVDGRTIALSTTTPDHAGFVERAAAMAGRAPLDPRWPGLSPVRGVGFEAACDEATKAATPRDRADRVREFVNAVEGLVSAGYCRTVAWSGAYRNTAGQALDAESASADMDGIARLNGSDSVARRHSARLSDIDGAALGARAARGVRTQQDPVELPPGRYEVIFEPEAVCDLLQNFAFHGFNGKVFNEGRSFAELGAPQFDPLISIHDDPYTGQVGARPFDHEGTPRSRLALVENGITTGITHDRRTAKEAGARSTGHAVPGENWGPMAANLGLAPGITDLASMIASVERGILVRDLWYTRVLDPRTLVLTGLTRNGTWLIEKGEIVKPVRNFRFTQAYPQALAPGQVLGIGPEAIPQPSRRELNTMSCPALHLASWNFTGGASG
jgi:predicted Zn-dependent protease